MIVFIRTLIGRELPPDQAEYCIQRMQPYSGMDAVQVEIQLNSLISHNLFQPFEVFSSYLSYPREPSTTCPSPPHCMESPICRLGRPLPR